MNVRMEQELDQVITPAIKEIAAKQVLELINRLKPFKLHEILHPDLVDAIDHRVFGWRHITVSDLINIVMTSEKPRTSRMNWDSVGIEVINFIKENGPVKTRKLINYLRTYYPNLKDLTKLNRRILPGGYMLRKSGLTAGTVYDIEKLEEVNK